MGTDTATAVLTIDLGAIAANWRALNAMGVTRETAAVVKADAYGLGVRDVAPALAAAGCRTFCVATADEAISLRAISPTASIVVLGGLFANAAPDYAAHDLIPALGSLAEVDAWSALARRLDRPLPAILHLDTGMSRLGLDAQERETLTRDQTRLAGLDLRYIMSHLVSAEVADDPLNALQLARFQALRARLPMAPASLANSSGMFLGAEYGLDLARPGAALYGVNPTPGRPNPMRSVVTLRARVLAVRDIPAGSTVGYSATWTAARDSRIVTVGVGYADGWLRTHSNMGAAFFDGHPIPLVGRVSMDLTTFDATDRPDIQPGCWLELLGPRHGVDAAALDAGTIGYEILTSLGRRYAPGLFARVNRFLAILSAIGRGTLDACAATGKIAMFAAEGLSHIVRPPFYGRLFLTSLLDIGYFSLPVVALTAVFTGMVLALQSYTGFSRFSAQGAVANLVVLSVTRELGPVLAGLMVAGRVGAAMAAELGTMRVTDQIDALTTLSTHPMKYLVAPRLLAGIVALPLLVLIADILGVMGGFIVSTLKLGFNVSTYLTNTMNFVQSDDVISGLAKAAVFGFLIALMGCYHGYNSKGGAQGVGAATTSAVVSASILILAFDYVLTEMFFSR